MLAFLYEDQPAGGAVFPAQYLFQSFAGQSIENSWQVFWRVYSSSWSIVIPRTCAMRAAVWSIMPESQRLPRQGTGAI